VRHWRFINIAADEYILNILFANQLQLKSLTNAGALEQTTSFYYKFSGGYNDAKLPMTTKISINRYCILQMKNDTKKQTYNNHVHYVPLYHFLTFSDGYTYCRGHI
jgi:hypothetical protein